MNRILQRVLRFWQVGVAVFLCDMAVFFVSISAFNLSAIFYGENVLYLACRQASLRTAFRCLAHSSKHLPEDSILVWTSTELP